MFFESLTRACPNPVATLVLLHGLGSDEHDMYGLAEYLDERIEVICLRAPKPYGPGFAWFDIQWTDEGIQVNIDEYWDSVGQLKLALEELNKSKLIIGGFSQGAMMSLGLISKYPTLASNCVLLSGRGIENPAVNFMGNIFQGHGRFDEVIPVSEARKLKLDLLTFGDRFEYHEYEMPHSINDQELSDLNRWFAKVLDLE
jgi:phospholipase/carboxylesterase